MGTPLFGGARARRHIDASHGAVLSNINVEGCIADFGGGISVATSNDVALTSITATNSHALAVRLSQCTPRHHSSLARSCPLLHSRPLLLWV